MIKSKYNHRSITLLILVFLLGCVKIPPPQTITLSKAHKKLVKISKEEYGLDIIIKPLENTLWVYLPLKERLLDFKASAEDPKFSNKPIQSQIIHFLDGRFQDNAIHIEYDISAAKTYSKDYGTTTAYAQGYQRKQQNVLTAIHRAYAEVKRSTDGAESSVPDFAIIVVADIVNGIEMKTTVSFQDLQRVFIDQSFQEEYTKRAMTGYPLGRKSIIADREGRHLEFDEMTWPEFIAKQIVYRLQFKYQRSAFPPSDDTRYEITKIAATAVQSYDFRGFRALILHDLRSNADYEIDKSELLDFKAKEPAGS